MGFLARVDVRVLLHVGLLVKPLATIFAGKRPRVRVDEHVGGEGGGTLEGLVALLAGEHLFVGVHDHMLLKTHRMPERFAAHVTLEGSTTRVRTTYMDLQSVRSIEPFLTFDALKVSRDTKSFAFGGEQVLLLKSLDGFVFWFFQVVQEVWLLHVRPAVVHREREGVVDFVEKRWEKIWKLQVCFVGPKVTS